jgi:citrate/tricarballylate utilization protein
LEESPEGRPPLQRSPDPIAEGQRLMTICNACRYCEGFCAVFPAMERRMTFAAGDIEYLANLCHNCAECYYACQYAPPHEFAVNVPQVFARARAHSYQANAWPRWMWRKSIPVWILAIATILLVRRAGPAVVFYDVIRQSWMTGIFLTASLWVLLSLTIGLCGFLRDTPLKTGGPAALLRGIRDALSLKNLGSNGTGCTYPDEQHSVARRRYHHLTFYGFMLCFTATTVAAAYHYLLGLEAPYAYTSAPVVLGTLGGIGLLIGPIGLYRLKQRRDPAIGDPSQDDMDVGFLAMLFFTSLTGLLLLLLRETEVMRPLLLVHLIIVMALFLTMPYGKFVHGIYRTAALARNAMEQHSRILQK